jgi:hypothetical protein
VHPIVVKNLHAAGSTSHDIQVRAHRIFEVLGVLASAATQEAEAILYRISELVLAQAQARVSILRFSIPTPVAMLEAIERYVAAPKEWSRVDSALAAFGSKEWSILADAGFNPGDLAALVNCARVDGQLKQLNDYVYVLGTIASTDFGGAYRGLHPYLVAMLGSRAATIGGGTRMPWFPNDLANIGHLVGLPSHGIRSFAAATSNFSPEAFAFRDLRSIWHAAAMGAPGSLQLAIAQECERNERDTSCYPGDTNAAKDEQSRRNPDWAIRQFPVQFALGRKLAPLYARVVDALAQEMRPALTAKEKEKQGRYLRQYLEHLKVELEAKKRKVGSVELGGTAFKKLRKVILPAYQFIADELTRRMNSKSILLVANLNHLTPYDILEVVPTPIDGHEKQGYSDSFTLWAALIRSAANTLPEDKQLKKLFKMTAESLLHESMSRVLKAKAPGSYFIDGIIKAYTHRQASTQAVQKAQGEIKDEIRAVEATIAFIDTPSPEALVIYGRDGEMVYQLIKALLPALYKRTIYIIAPRTLTTVGRNMRGFIDYLERKLPKDVAALHFDTGFAGSVIKWVAHSGWNVTKTKLISADKHIPDDYALLADSKEDKLRDIVINELEHQPQRLRKPGAADPPGTWKYHPEAAGFWARFYGVIKGLEERGWKPRKLSPKKLKRNPTQ